MPKPLLLHRPTGLYARFRVPTDLRGMSVPEAKRLKDLKSESGHLKKLLAKQPLENEVIKERGGVGCTNVGYGCDLNFVAVGPAREHLVDLEPVDQDRHVRSVTLA